jgi:hypothetical protein
MGIFDRLFGNKATRQPDPNVPFMEHPTGDFGSAVDAMAEAIKRLRTLTEWNDWITFCAQGMGHDMESEQHAEIRMRRDELQLGESIDMELVSQHAGVPRSRLAVTGATYSIAHASPAEGARIMDAIFRLYLGIRPFPDEGDDYAVGAEW